MITNDSLILAYVAGIIDGEGCFHVRRSTGALTLRVGMTDVGFIEDLPRLVGVGTTHTQRRYLAADGVTVREQRCWSISRRVDLLELLEEVLPYMRVRRDDAELFITRLEAALY